MKSAMMYHLTMVKTAVTLDPLETNLSKEIQTEIGPVCV